MYSIGKTFYGSFPSDAASFCNAKGNCYVKEVEPTSDGTRVFQIVETSFQSEDYLSKKARIMRDELISSTDYLVLPDYPISDDERALVFAYRQALRDVPQQDGFPTSISWPEKPSFLKSE